MAGTDTTAMLRCEADGFEFEAAPGTTLMVALRNTGFDIEASCDGNLACGTCHVKVVPEWAGRLPPAADDERAMLDYLPGATATSRLSCQIRLTPELDGLSVEIARPA